MSGVQALSAIENRSTAVVIADQLRERIIDGAFVLGEQINEAQVAAQLRVSRGPVREALNRLVQEGLLVSRPNRGVFVCELTVRDIAEVYEAREVLECAAAETITKMDAESRSSIADRLSAFTKRMQPAVDARDFATLSRIDIEFHTSIVEAAGNMRLLRAYATLAAEALMCMSHFEYVPPKLDRVLPGHQEIAELLRDGDMEAVHLALHRHLSIDGDELHGHDEDGALRHGRNEEHVELRG